MESVAAYGLPAGPASGYLTMRFLAQLEWALVHAGSGRHGAR